MTWGILTNNYYMYQPMPMFSPMAYPTPCLFGGRFYRTMFALNMVQNLIDNMFKPQTYYQPRYVQYNTPYYNNSCSCRSLFENTQNYVNNYLNNQNFCQNFYPNYYPNYSFDNPFLIRNFDNLEAFKKEETELQQVKPEKKYLDGKNEYVRIACEKARKYGVDERLVLAIIQQESGFVNRRTSNKGAQGLMQLMPATAKELGVTDINDPEQNIDAGVRYIKKMLVRYNGNVKMALAAYNAGMGNVDKYNGIPPFKETQNYVAAIYNNYKNYSVA